MASAFHFTPGLRAVQKATAGILKGKTIFVIGGQIPWAVRDGKVYPIPLGRRAP